jgi:hypothetical protein
MNHVWVIVALLFRLFLEGRERWLRIKRIFDIPSVNTGYKEDFRNG